MSIRVRDGKPGEIIKHGEIIHEEQDGAVGQDGGPDEPNPAWVAFFKEARRLAALARERRAARETIEGQDDPRA